jgi:hypothetical protein
VRRASLIIVHHVFLGLERADGRKVEALAPWVFERKTSRYGENIGLSVFECVCGHVAVVREESFGIRRGADLEERHARDGFGGRHVGGLLDGCEVLGCTVGTSKRRFDREDVGRDVGVVRWEHVELLR